jgi:hypothetical protein
MKHGIIIEGDMDWVEGDDYSDVVEVRGCVSAYGAGAGAFTALATVGGYVDARGADAGAFPALTTVGGNVYAYGASAGAFPVLASKSDLNAARAAFRAIGFLFADGILARLLASRSARGMTVHRVVIVGKTEVSYCIETAAGVFSHGGTLKEARDSLIYKIADRDTSKYDGWTLDTVVSLAEAIGAYRAITGACEQGTRLFVETAGKLPKKATVREVIKLTRGQYEAETFAKFFTGKGFK